MKSCARRPPSRPEPSRLPCSCVGSPPIPSKTPSPRRCGKSAGLERTLFTLDWISDPALRRRTNAGLNKGEARNALRSRLLPSSRRNPRPHLRKSAPPRLRPQSRCGRHHPLEHRISAAPSTSCARGARPSVTTFSPISPRSAGSTSPSTAIMSGRRSPSETLPAPTKSPFRLPRSRLAYDLERFHDDPMSQKEAQHLLHARAATPPPPLAGRGKDRAWLRERRLEPRLA